MFSSDIEEKIKAMVCHSFCVKLLQEIELVRMNVLAKLFFSFSGMILSSYTLMILLSIQGVYATLLLDSSTSKRVLFACK